MLFWILLTLLTPCFSADIYTAYDCELDPKIESQYSLLNQKKCVEKSNPMIQNPVSIVVTQKKTLDTLEAYACKVIAHHRVFQCGKMIDTSVNKGLYSEIIKFDSSECLKLHRDRYFIYGTNKVRIEKNGASRQSLVTWGKIQDGKCSEGEERDFDGVHVERPVQQTDFEIEVLQLSLILNIEDGTVSTATGSKYKYDQLYAYDSLFGNIFWTKVNSVCTLDLEIIYEGPATELVYDKNTESKDDLDSKKYYLVKNEDYHFLLKDTGLREEICGFISIRTLQAGIYITKKIDGVSFPNLPVISKYNVNIFSYIDVKESTTVHQISDALKIMSNTEEFNRCLTNSLLFNTIKSLSKQFPQDVPSLLGYPDGYTAIQSGDIVSIIKCQKVETLIRHTTGCFDSLPVVYREKDYFVDNTHKILKRTSKKIDCNPVLSPKYYIDGQWFEPSNHGLLKSKIIPKDMEDTMVVKGDKDVDVDTNGGIYNDQAKKAFRSAILTPLSLRDVQSTFMEKISDIERDSGFSLLNALSASDLQDIEKHAKTWYMSYYEKTRDLGSFSSLIIISILAIKTMIAILDSLFNFQLLLEHVGVMGAFFGSLCNGLTHYILKKKKGKKEDEEKQESVPLNKFIGNY